jgi:hypothetical protein
MTRRTEAVPQEPPDFLTVDEVAAVLRISRNRAYELVRLGVATSGRAGVAAERVDKQFRISRYVIEARLGGPITWPIPGFHDIAEPEPATPSGKKSSTHRDLQLETASAMPTRKCSKSTDPTPDTELRLFPL